MLYSGDASTLVQGLRGPGVALLSLWCPAFADRFHGCLLDVHRAALAVMLHYSLQASCITAVMFIFGLSPVNQHTAEVQQHQQQLLVWHSPASTADGHDHPTVDGLAALRTQPVLHPR